MTSTEPEAPFPLSDAIRAEMARWSVPGLAVGIRRGARVESAAFGVADLATNEPVTPETIFGIGSISKVFTATLAMRLADAGLLDLDAPIMTHLPDLRLGGPTARRTITMRHLLTHTGGLVGDGVSNHGRGDDALARAVADLHARPQVTAPGELWSYCNGGFVIAGAAIAAITGTTFESAMRDRILAPLGLRRTSFNHVPPPPPVATGYDHEPGRPEKVIRPGRGSRSVNPAGGMVSTVADLLRFARFHHGDGTLDGRRVLSMESTRRMRRPQVQVNSVESWGIGWGIRTIGDVPILEHNGWNDGYRARLCLIPATGDALAILCSGGHGHAAIHAIAKALLGAVFGLPEPEPVPVKVPAATLARYAGRYATNRLAVTLAPANSGLTAAIETKWRDPSNRPPAPVRLVPVAADEFVVVDGEFAGERITFIAGINGRPRFVRVLGRLAAPVRP